LFGTGRVQVSTGFSNTMYLDSGWTGERDITMEEFDVVPGILPFRVASRSSAVANFRWTKTRSTRVSCANRITPSRGWLVRQQCGCKTTAPQTLTLRYYVKASSR
jgi:hypothetical protein